MGFRFAALVDDQEVLAEWTADGLVASEALMRRASVVVGMGENFERPDGTVVIAGLANDPTAALLTLVRAADRSLEVSIFFWSEDPDQNLPVPPSLEHSGSAIRTGVSHSSPALHVPRPADKDPGVAGEHSLDLRSLPDPHRARPETST